MGGAAITHHVLGEVLQKHITLSYTFKHDLNTPSTQTSLSWKGLERMVRLQSSMDCW